MNQKDGLIRKKGKLEPSGINYLWPKHNKVYGFGAPISVNGARGLIKNFWAALKKKKMEEFIDFKKTPAFTIGKEPLLWLLSQENCEAVRFYFALKSEADWGGKGEKPANWSDGLTLVAVGVKNNQKEIIDGVDFLISGIEKKEIPNDGERKLKDASNPDDGGVVETIPPTPGDSKICSIVSSYLK